MNIEMVKDMTTEEIELLAKHFDWAALFHHKFTKGASKKERENAAVMLRSLAAQYRSLAKIKSGAKFMDDISGDALASGGF